MATLVEAAPGVVQTLEGKLKDPATQLPEKYRVLFSLRNVAGSDAHAALVTGAACAAAASSLSPPHNLTNVSMQLYTMIRRCFATMWRSAWVSGRTPQPLKF
jgi:hypothetical protein